MSRTPSPLRRFALACSALAAIFTVACGSADATEEAAESSASDLTLVSRTYVAAAVPLRMSDFQKDCATCGGRLMKECQVEGGRIKWDTCVWQCVGGYNCALAYGFRAN
jgi:hypothetical protein